MANLGLVVRAAASNDITGSAVRASGGGARRVGGLSALAGNTLGAIVADVVVASLGNVVRALFPHFLSALLEGHPLRGLFNDLSSV